MNLLEAKQIKLVFGVHLGATLGDVAERDVTYLDFLASQSWLDFHLREAVAVLCEHYGRKPKQNAAREDSRQGSLF